MNDIAMCISLYISDRENLACREHFSNVMGCVIGTNIRQFLDAKTFWTFLDDFFGLHWTSGWKGFEK